MSYLNQNIKYLRKQKGYTQDVLAQKMGVKRAAIGAYEEHRAEPKIVTMQKFATLFGVTIDELINMDLNTDNPNRQVDVSGKALRVLPIMIDAQNNEFITVVPEKAEAGYAHRYSDPEYIEELPSFSLPINELYQDSSYRLFQISGDSMLPVVSGSYIITSYVEDWHNVKNGQCYIVVTRDQGIVYKRLSNELEDGRFLLTSDNSTYEPYHLQIEEIVEIWLANGYISFSLPDHQQQLTPDLSQVNDSLSVLKDDVHIIKQILQDQKNGK